MAEVKGKRLLIAAEMQEGARLNDSTVKQLCSTDDVFAEKKYKDPFSFKPCHTLVLYTCLLYTSLSASSSDRWLHCPPSARLCETYEDKGSDYAAEGTDAHSLCEYKLRKALGMEATDPTENLVWYNAEMEDCATGYASFIMELLEEAKQTCSDPVVLIEQRVDFSRWVEQGFGTSDAILISDGTMHVIDYKHCLLYTSRCV